MSVNFPSLLTFSRTIAILDSFIASCLMKLRKLSVGRSKLTVTLCTRKGDYKKTKEQLKLNAKPFKNCRCVPKWQVLFSFDLYFAGNILCSAFTVWKWKSQLKAGGTDQWEWGFEEQVWDLFFLKCSGSQCSVIARWTCVFEKRGFVFLKYLVSKF